MNDFKVGQVVYLKRERRELQETNIEKVGRKYLYLKYCPGIKINKETLTESDYIGYPSKVYLTREDYDNERLKYYLSRQLNNYNRWNELSIESLRKINDIIKEEMKRDD